MKKIIESLLRTYNIKDHYVKIPHNPNRVVEFTLVDVKHWPIYKKTFYTNKDLVSMAFGC